MEKLILLLATLSLTAPAYTQKQMEQGRKHAERVAQQLDHNTIGTIQVLGTQAIDAMIRKGCARIARLGHKQEAEAILSDWEDVQQFAVYDAIGNRPRHIMDHSPLSQWLRDVDITFKLLLGVPVWTATHLSDLETMNSGIPVVVRPCSFPMDNVTIDRKFEFQNHFAWDVNPNEGDKLYGVAPVITYWAIEIPCIASTSGLLSFVCSPVSSIAESIMAKRIGPKLSDKIWERVCGTTEG